MIYLGCDPGKSGAIAAIHDPFVSCGPSWIGLDSTEQDIVDFLRDLKRSAGRKVDSSAIWAVAQIEKVGATPQMGVVSAFTFGRGYGALEMVLIAVGGIHVERVSPSAWQRSLGCLSKGDKNVTKRKAQELFGMVKITHRNADALLLAEYARRSYQEGWRL